MLFSDGRQLPEGDPVTECYASVDDECMLLRILGIFKSRFKDGFDFMDE